MNETFPTETEVQATEVSEPASQKTEGATAPLDDEAVTEVETMVVVDYTPVIYEVGNSLAAVQMFCTFLIVGVLIAFKIMEVKR